MYAKMLGTLEVRRIGVGGADLIPQSIDKLRECHTSQLGQHLLGERELIG
jgi:hypothetical protein